MTEPLATPPSPRKLLVGGGVAAVAAVASVLLFVLPAEFGIDPTGFGKATRLTEIAAPPNKYLAKGLKRKGVLALSATPLPPQAGATDRWQFELGPYESIEMKYVLEQGKSMTFAWSATGRLNYDMHAYPFAEGQEASESFKISSADRLYGTYVAPFTGAHGWYWQNRGFERVKITVDASGDMTGAKTFDQFGEHDRELTGGP